jgi:hypothetical protein
VGLLPSFSIADDTLSRVADAGVGRLTIIPAPMDCSVHPTGESEGWEDHITLSDQNENDIANRFNRRSERVQGETTVYQKDLEIHVSQGSWNAEI